MDGKGKLGDMGDLILTSKIIGMVQESGKVM
jgi:hypothetical protein